MAGLIVENGNRKDPCYDEIGPIWSKIQTLWFNNYYDILNKYSPWTY
jgi:hypothetical protein